MSPDPSTGTSAGTLAATGIGTFGILLFPGVEELDAIGPWEMAALWARQPSGPEQCLMIGQGEVPITCAKGMVLLPHASFATAPPLDVLLVPGGQGTRTEVSNPELIAFIRRQSASCRAVLSDCTGAFLLHAAGLLGGRRATTHWASLERLRALGDVDVVEERFPRDGAIWSAAGISSGIDLMLSFIAETGGEDAAAQVQLESEYFPALKVYGTAASSGNGSAYFRTS
ncbi:DJ-1/PfpI family protein [Cyanobium gracile]|uniref:Transcriptional regulator containing an amidase domain and an AraC-type DNA-binding HTH domain n=1 Tax=Cyanobium gracile (strain ATCC 27147 / PCC 6307) TaxID=292564 RepID=K9PBY7_CYAGP|nr:DJ-1/PfpI family protein [Cyanobium gracile]AFY30458.1 transcriptional regulator containing an amidase domain and an AraC-type DNA-binding HTH domain [Cyanobium gracile PCC 6307]